MTTIQQIGIMTSKKTSSLSDVSIWIASLGCIASVSPWFIWSFPAIRMVIMLLFVCIRIFLIKPRYSYATLLSLFGVILFSFVYCQFFVVSIKASLSPVASILLPVMLFILLDGNEKKIFLNRTINIFSVILFFSLVWYLLYFFIDLPYRILRNNNPGYPLFRNYFFFIITETNVSALFPRFNSIYTEPGHQGMTCAILLYISGYSLRKWQNIMMTISLICSFSLAGYVLYAIGLILYILSRSHNIAITSFKIVTTVVIVIVCGMAWYSPTNDDVVSIKILSRLELDESGDIAGNNRNTANFEQYFDKFTHTDKKYFGIGTTEFDSRYRATSNSSYKNFVIAHGYVGLLSMLFMMGIHLFSFPSRRGLGLMLLLCASFLQRPYFLWAIQVMPYIAALEIFCMNSKKCMVKRVASQRKITKK